MPRIGLKVESARRGRVVRLVVGFMGSDVAFRQPQSWLPEEVYIVTRRSWGRWARGGVVLEPGEGQ